VKVYVRKDNVEQAIKVLRKKVQKEGILKAVRQKSYFEKPSAKRARKRKEGRANMMKKKRKMEKMGLL
jgi:small subunit ribosomal protein S21